MLGAFMNAVSSLASRPPTVVAHISKGYVDGLYIDANPFAHEPIGVTFEKVIEANRLRGYDLHSWQMSSTALIRGDQTLANDTLVAVFTRRKSDAPTN